MSYSISTSQKVQQTELLRQPLSKTESVLIRQSSLRNELHPQPQSWEQEWGITNGIPLSYNTNNYHTENETTFIFQQSQD